MNNLLKGNFDMTSEINLVDRAVTAYFKKSVRDNLVAMQPSNDSTVESIGNRSYVVLRNAKGILAVYGVRSSDGILKGLNRWPTQLGQEGEGRVEQ